MTVATAHRDSFVHVMNRTTSDIDVRTMSFANPSMIDALNQQIKMRRDTRKFKVTQPYTPYELIDEINQLILPGKDKDVSIAVLFTVEWAVALKAAGFNNITVVTSERDEHMNRFCEALLNTECKTFNEVSDLKFDVVVGNPPFQSVTDGSKRKKAWVTFAQIALDLANDTVGFITPRTWMNGSKYFDNIGKKIKQNVVVTGDANSHFSVGTDIGYWITDSKRAPCEIVNSNPFQPIYNKMLRSGAKWHYRDFQLPYELSKEKTETHSMPVYWTAKQVRWAKPGSIREGWKVIVNNSGGYHDSKNPERYSTCNNTQGVGLGAWGIAVNSEEEGIRMLSWIRSKLYSVVVTKIKTGGFNNPFVELQYLGVDRAWTDAELYAHFNLTQEEIDLIEATVK